MWLRTWLRRQGYDATLVHNITDVNDKIYDAAPGASAALAARASAWYVEDIGDFGLGLPDELPRATEHVPGILRFIADLVERGYAYPAAGDVYFRVSRDPGYGRLSRQRPDQMDEEERNPLKEDPRDFALWKATKPGEDTSWEAPWGMGRPGWHIECSAMARAAYGPVFEIHGGGLDLVFPHHENEVAQSHALGHPFARIWAHNGMLRPVGSDKMSKSAGNFETIRDVLDEWGRETILVFFLTASWRKPIDYSAETMRQAAARRDTLRNAFTLEAAPVEEARWGAFAAALDDDFDTPAALAVLHEWATAGQLELLRRGLAIFGLESLATREEAPDEVRELARRRARARAERDFETSDRLRDELAGLGWEMRDAPGGDFTLVRRDA
jgi:cysteinyl-tRNA synthetase